MRRSGTILVTALIAATLLFVGLNVRSPSENHDSRPFLPELVTAADNISSITLTHRRQSTHLVKSGNQWRVSGRGNYPADAQAIDVLVYGLRYLQRIEPKTGNPLLFDKLGLDPKSDPDSDSLQLTIEFSSDRASLHAILGKQKENMTRDGSKLVFARRPDENRAWLLRGYLPEYRPSNAWLQKPVLNLDIKAIRKISIRNENGRYLVIESPDSNPGRFSRSGASNPDYHQSSHLARLIAELKLEDVSARDEISIENPPPLTINIENRQGKTVVLRTADLVDGTWAVLETDQPDISLMSNLWKKWAYRLPRARIRSLETAVGDSHIH